MDDIFIIKITPEFEKVSKKVCKKTPGLSNKLKQTFQKVMANPFEPNVENSKIGERRAWVGDSHRMFYIIKGNIIYPTNLKKKDKNTYK